MASVVSEVAVVDWWQPVAALYSVIDGCIILPGGIGAVAGTIRKAMDFLTGRKEEVKKLSETRKGTKTEMELVLEQSQQGFSYEVSVSTEGVEELKRIPLPAAISPTAESPGYIIDSEPEMDPEEEDGDDEKSKRDSIDYPTSRGDDDVDDNLLEDDADDEDEEESSDREEEEEEHLASTVPASALHSSISASEDSDQTEPFEKGETAATPPPSAYRVTARISIRPHIPMPFPSKSEVKRLLAIPTPPLSPVSPTSYPLPPFLMSLPIFTPLPPSPIILPRTRASMVLMRSAALSTFILAPLSRRLPIGTPSLLLIPLPTSSFSLPLLLPTTACREGIPEADMPLRKKARFTTPTSGYEVGESSVAAVARQIMPALTVDDSHRAEDRLIGRLRRERRYFRTLSTTYAQEVAHSRDYFTQIIDYCQSREVHTSTLVTQIEALQRDVSTLEGQQIDDEDRLTRHIQHEHAQRDAAPEDGDSCS
nr:hypothetical protein [Tanacetum cinerariifolium]